MGNTIGFTATLYRQTLFDLHWEMWQSWLHARFYERLRGLLVLLGLACGGFLLGSLLASEPRLCALALGLLLSLAAFAWRYGVKGRIARSTAAYKDCVALLGAAPNTPMIAVENRLRRLQADAAPALDSLRWVAYNAAIRTSGMLDEPTPLNAWQRGVGLIVRGEAAAA